MQDTASSAQERFFPLSLRTRASIYSIIAAALLLLLIALGSRGFHWFDTALLGYAVATTFAVAAVTYKYTLWLTCPPTGRYWWRSWRLLLSYENMRHYRLLIAKAITELFAQEFIRKRGLYRWLTHQCIFWGV
ncbi:MAG: MFS transporter, partial [Ktedonobacteraceae bacterium]|nr:MFS transporter [Ktedonobacteraceae bacterium]